MDKCVGRKLPERTVQNLGAVELQKIQDAAAAERNQKTAEHHAGNVRRDEQGGHIDGIASHPGDRPVIIGGRDSEHDLLVAAVYDRRKFSVVRSASLVAALSLQPWLSVVAAAVTAAEDLLLQSVASLPLETAAATTNGRKFAWRTCVMR